MSSLRPLDTRVAKAELFLRRCERGNCQRAFLYCRSREPGRRYCLECSPVARREREQKARREYRDSDEGREQHRDEESRRREKRRFERAGVGDRRCATESGQVQTRATAAAYQSAVEEKSDARQEVEWLLVAWPGLLAAAEQMLGTRVACPCCGRHGQVIEVLELDECRRRRRKETS